MTLYSSLTGDYLIHHGIEIHFVFKHGYSMDHVGFVMYALYNEILENAGLSTEGNVVTCKHYELDEIDELPEILKTYIKSTKIYKEDDLRYIEIYSIPSSGYPTSGSYKYPSNEKVLMSMTPEEICLKFTCVFENIDELLKGTNLRYDDIMKDYRYEMAKAGYIKSLHGKVKFRSDPCFEFVKTEKEKSGGICYNPKFGSFYCGIDGNFDDPKNYVSDR